MTDVEKLQQLSELLKWFRDEYCGAKRWGHYSIQVQSTRNLVENEIMAHERKTNR